MVSNEAEKQAVIFFCLITFVVAAILGLYFLNMWSTLGILLIILIALVIMYTQSGSFFAELQEYERAVVFSMGHFKKVAGPGWLFLIPFIETYVKVDLRTKTIDTKAQQVITKDNIKLTLDAIVYAKVNDPKSAIINVDDYTNAMKTYVESHLRSVIGQMDLNDTISQIEKINNILAEGLQHVSKDWGVAVEKVEVQSIELPKSVTEAMHERRAATERKFAQKERAEAKKLTIDAIQESAGKLTDSSLQYLYLQALQKVAEGKSSKIIFPMELSRIAESLSGKLGSFDKAQSEVVKEYQEKAVKGEKPESIIDAMRRRAGLPEAKRPSSKSKQKKSDDFDFE